MDCESAINIYNNNNNNNERQIASEKLANHMKDRELNDFWKDVRKVVNLILHCLIALTE